MTQTLPQKDEMIGATINGKYSIRKMLGEGSFGAVYEAEDLQTEKILALKFELGTATNPQLPNEYKCYSSLQHMDNIPKVYDLFEYKKNKVMVMDKMGPSLHSLFKRCDGRFSLKTTLMIADQLLRIIQYVHDCGLLHRDIKPQNFVTGIGPLRTRVHLLDFGVSTSYLDPRTHEHMMFTTNNGLVGTAYYVSVNTHLGDLQSRRDDLESIAYVLIQFAKGSLPWQKKWKDAEDQAEKISQAKLQISTEELCSGIPNEFRAFLDYCRKLRFDETPNYAWWRQSFKKLFINQGFVNDGIYDWDDNAPIYKPLPSVVLIQSAAMFQQVNARKSRNSRRIKIKLPPPRNIFLCGIRFE